MSQVSDIIVRWVINPSTRITGIQIQSRIAGVEAWTEQAAAYDHRAGQFRFTANAPATEVEVRARYRMINGYGGWLDDSIITANASVKYNTIIGTPTSLGDLNAGEGIKLGGIEPGATYGAPGNSPVGNKTAQAVIDGMGINTSAILAEGLRQDDLARVLDARTLVAGQPVGTEFLNFKNDQVRENSAIASSLSLIGAKNSTGTAWNLNLDTVQVAPGKTLGTKLTEIGAESDGVKASVSNLNQVLITPQGPLAKAILRVDANGVIAGYSATSDGRQGVFAIAADVFRIVDPNGGAPFIPFEYSNGTVRIPNLVASNFSIGSVATDAVALGSISARSFYQHDYGGAIGTSLGASASRQWAVFGSGVGAPAQVSPPSGGIVPAGSNVFIRMYVNARRTGSDNDRVSFRLRRNQAGQTPVYIGDILLSGMGNYPSSISYEWIDTIDTTANYSYSLEYSRDEGDGSYYVAKLICDVSKR